MPPVSFPTVAGHEVSSSWKSQLPKLQRWWNVLRFNLESRSPRLLQRHDFSSLCGTFTNPRPTTSYDVLRFKISWRHSTDGGIFPKISQSSDETSAANHCASDVFMAKQRYNQALSKRQSKRYPSAKACLETIRYTLVLVGGFNPSEKWWTSSVGILWNSQLNGKSFKIPYIDHVFPYINHIYI